MTTDIDIAGRTNLKFPPICVVCDADDPTEAITISVTGAMTEPLLIEAASVALADRTYSSNTENKIAGIPVCRTCAGTLARYHYWIKIATYTSWIPGLILFLVLPAPVWVRVLILIACVIGPGIFQVIKPPAFGATFLNSRATFEFRSKRCAIEFARINGIEYEEETD